MKRKEWIALIGSMCLILTSCDNGAAYAGETVTEEVFMENTMEAFSNEENIDSGYQEETNVSQSESLPETVPETAVMSETGTMPETEAVPETGPVPETVAVPETDPIPETAAMPETDPVSETDPIPETETTPETDPISETETFPETEKKQETETITGLETFPETETISAEPDDRKGVCGLLQSVSKIQGGLSG